MAEGIVLDGRDGQVPLRHDQRRQHHQQHRLQSGVSFFSFTTHIFRHASRGTGASRIGNFRLKK